MAKLRTTAAIMGYLAVFSIGHRASTSIEISRIANHRRMGHELSKDLGAEDKMVKSGPAKGQGALDTVILRHVNGAQAQIYLWGATLCSYKTPDGKEQIFVSPSAQFNEKKAIRGGVPIVFPQFGRPIKSMPQHGFARISLWSVKEVMDSPEESLAVLSLSDSDETREMWPYSFTLEYVVSLTSSHIKSTLRVSNTGDVAFHFHALLHTYYNIPEVANVSVRGLKDRRYADKTAGGEVKAGGMPEVTLPSYTDRIYIAAAAESTDVSIADAGADIFEISNEAYIDDVQQKCDIVVWNPYEEASPSDLPPPAYKKFVCVEPGMVTEMKQLLPKATAKLSQKIVIKSS